MVERIESIKDFYGSVQVSTANIITEELKSGEYLSADAKGKWCLDQFESTAKALRITRFILPMDKGGCEVPVIAEKEDYLINIKASSASSVSSVASSTFPIREKMRQRALEEMTTYELELEHWEQIELPEEPPLDPEPLKEWKAAVKERATKCTELKKKCEESYTKWHAFHSELQRDQQKLEEWEEKIAKKAETQRREDTDAVTNVGLSLGALKKFLQGLMLKVPEIGSTVKKMGADHIDPYTAGDMRQVYANLTERYRNGDTMGVTTTLIGGMRLTQSAQQSLPDFVRKIEEFHQHVVVLGVKEVPVADLVAMVALGGMHSVYMKAFLDLEATVALTVKNLEIEEDDGLTSNSSGGSVSSRKQCDKRNLLEKVVAFSNSRETQKLIASNLSASGVQTGTKEAPDPEAAKRKKMEAEARSVLAVFSKGDKLSPAERAANGQCRRFRENGHCAYGDYCKFTHSGDTGGNTTPAAAVAGQPDTATKKNAVNVSVNEAMYGKAARALFSTRKNYSPFYHSDSD